MFTDTFKPTSESLNRVNKLVMDTYKGVAEVQMTSLRNYMEMIEDQARAAAAIRDLEGAKGFIEGQTERFNQLVSRMSEDLKQFSDVAENFRNEAFELFQEPVDGASEETGTDTPKADAS